MCTRRLSAFTLTALVFSGCAFFGGGGGGDESGDTTPEAALMRAFSGFEVLEDPPTDESILVDMSGGGGMVEIVGGGTSTITLPFEAPDGNVVGIGVRFGDSGGVAVIPTDTAGQTQGVLQATFTVPASICDDLASICHQIICYEFAVTDIGAVSRANITDVAMACNDCSEPSCQSLLQSCEQAQCNDTVTAGGDAPESHTIDLGQNSGTFTFSWDNGGSISDIISVVYEGDELFTTGCVSSASSVDVPYDGNSSDIQINITPNCDDPNATGTSWEFSVGCPQ